VYDFIASSSIPAPTTLIVDALYDGRPGHRNRVWSHLRCLLEQGRVRKATRPQNVRGAHHLNYWEAVR
jgi:hypothetical protein